MDIYGLVYNILRYIVYPICIVFVGLEVYRYIWSHYIMEYIDDDDKYNEFHEPTIEMCSRCKNPDCSHRLADYIEED